MSTVIEYHPDEKLNFVYQSPNLVFKQDIGPMNKRFDTLQPTNAQLTQDSFLLQQPQDYLNLRIKKRDVYKVTGKAKTVAPAVGVVGTSPALIVAGQNWAVDNFCLSKQMKSISIKWGNNELQSTQDERNPWLYEMKSATYDLDECERHGLVPLLTSGMGNIEQYLGVGTVGRNDMGQYNLATLPNVPVAQNPSLAPSMQLAQKNQTQASNVRVRIMGDIAGEIAPVYTDLATPATAVVTRNDHPNFLGVWVPLIGYVNTANPGLPFYNAVEGVQAVYYVEVTEYLMDDFLTTPYQKNKSDKCIKVTPASMINFNFQYDTNYISNGLMKFGSFSQGSTLAVERQPNESKITLETFQLTTPPRSDYSLKLLTFRPTRVEGKSAILANGASTTFEIFDQSDVVLPPIIALSADPQFYNGDQNGALAVADDACSWNTFFPAKITDVEIQIGQVTVTENIPIEELQRMSADIINNDKLANWVNCKGNLFKYTTSQNASGSNQFSQNRGCPFLFIDVAKLALRNSIDCSQMVPNVEYPVPQTIKIKYTVQAQGGLYLLGNVTYYPHVYKFYPYIYEQRAGEALRKYRLQMGYLDSANLISYSNASNYGPVDLTMIGNGWFDDLKNFVKDNASSIGKTLLKGVRLGEQFTRDSENETLKNLNKGLRTVSDVAKQYGYGSRGSAIKHGKY